MMPAVTNQEILNAIGHSYYDYSMINAYSDLSYGFLNAGLGFEYKVSKSVIFTFDVNYFDLNDYQSYVYGNESGSYYVIRSGFRMSN